MKRHLRAPFAALLAWLARRVVRKYRPTIVMVTGSVGKTSTKDALKALLRSRGYIRASEKSYNSEFGVPLTILGAANPWTSPSAWVRVITEALLLLLTRNHYPRTLVLEVGADRPGDLRRILRIATPDVVVVTALPEVPVHVEAYPTPGAVREEEFTPAYALSPGAPLILCADDPHARALARPLAARCISYGFAQDADVRIDAGEPFMEEGRLVGMRGTLRIDGVGYSLEVRDAIGRPQLLAPAAAAAAAWSLGIPLAEAVADAAEYAPPPGRGRILAGVHDATLIDDTYNASPVAVIEALDSLTQAAAIMPRARRIAVLGDMLELGRFSHDEHEKVGHYAAARTEMLIAVGPRARAMGEAAVAAGLSAERVIFVESAATAAEALKPIVHASDLILIKGSQSMRMERTVTALLADPADSKHLVRQDGQWRKRVR